MSWGLPTPLLLFAGAAASVPLAFLLRRPASLPRLVRKAFNIALEVIAVVWLGWVAPWLIEQRWRRGPLGRGPKASGRSRPRMTLWVPPVLKEAPRGTSPVRGGDAPQHPKTS